jgi:hypothetical protein
MITARRGLGTALGLTCAAALAGYATLIVRSARTCFCPDDC